MAKFMFDSSWQYRELLSHNKVAETSCYFTELSKLEGDMRPTYNNDGFIDDDGFIDQDALEEHIRDDFACGADLHVSVVLTNEFNSRYHIAEWNPEVVADLMDWNDTEEPKDKFGYTVGEWGPFTIVTAGFPG